MTQEKMRRIITASAVSATLLLVFLFSFLVYQWVQIAVYNNRIKKLERENARLEEQLKEGTKDVEYYESIFGKEWLAHQNGYVRPSEE
jgi:cell division protein FtsB